MNYEENGTAEVVSDSEGVGTAEVVRTGAEAGRRDAAEAAKKFYGQISEGVGKAAYGLSYYSAFGAAFAVALAKEVMPSKVREGFAEGVKAGGDAAEKALTKVKDAIAKKREEEEETSEGGDLDRALPGS